jgi:2Fe-2S ferredoxin
MDANEDAMLGLSSDRRENSRLCCQITLNAELDGLTVTTPEFQF